MSPRPKSPLYDHHPALAARVGRRKPGQGRQQSLFCSCGLATSAVAGLCVSCYRHRRYAALYFGGNREAALERDGRACRGCRSQHYLNVHHRHPGDHTQLVTLCAGCHARVHRTLLLRRWLPEILIDLWRELHPDAVEQLLLPVEMYTAVLSEEGWQIFSDYPAPAPRLLLKDAPDSDGKDSRIFLPDPAQFGFDWAVETAEGGQ